MRNTILREGAAIRGAAKGLVICGIALFAFPACALTVEISNPLPEARVGEIVEIPASLPGLTGPTYVVYDANGREIQSQLTYDGKLIFPVTVDSLGTVRVSVLEGKPSQKFPVYVGGRQYPERKDDLAWENERSAYRAYGPALERSGERAFGYDIWSKSVAYPILEQRYYDDRVRRISFHEDHGNGQDDYAVGPTLGGGTAALLDKSGKIVYPYCYKEYEILDNGPLRFTVSLEYNPVKVDGADVTETRLISLDSGSWLNKTKLRYEGLKGKSRLVQGIVVHTNNPKAWSASEKGHYVANQDINQHPERNNGTVFVGIVSPASDTFRFMPMAEDVKDAEGHVVAVGDYQPGEEFTYWWGSGWSKGGVADGKEWESILATQSRHIANPLKIKIIK